MPFFTDKVECLLQFKKDSIDFLKIDFLEIRSLSDFRYLTDIFTQFLKEIS